MDLYYLIILAIVQGITEFLPISSSAHLALLPHILNVTDQGITIDVAVHVGTLLAVIVYFFSDSLSLIQGGIHTVRFKNSYERRLFLNLLIASLPIIIVGFTVHQLNPEFFRRIEVIAWATIIFAIFLWLADTFGSNRKAIDKMSSLDAFLVGVGQVFSLIIGASRSGVAMTAARALGYNREDTSRFALLMSIPTLAGAGLLIGMDIYHAGDKILTQNALIAAGMSFVAALLAISFLMNWVRSFTFTPFVIYRLLLGGFLLYTVYTV